MPPKLETSTISGGGSSGLAPLLRLLAMSSGTPCKQVAYTPRKPTPLHASHISMPCSQKLPRSSPGGVVYAEHTRMSTRPSASRTRASARSISASSFRLHAMPCPTPPAAVMASAADSTVRSKPAATARSVVCEPRVLRPRAYTVFPWRPSSMAMPRPMPRVAPVTTATRDAPTDRKAHRVTTKIRIMSPRCTGEPSGSRESGLA